MMINVHVVRIGIEQPINLQIAEEANVKHTMNSRLLENGSTPMILKQNLVKAEVVE
jgi:hypothetical protein